ncbi:MAG: 4-hydroxybutyrate CoA-transferase [Candidatus Magasanikbacteria bacterium CG_4_10_14_0_2_um_filter_37_12]|uniref:4-hydroxybutyrate CoA-transferase n=1 Tax=Candidatus Magasanikbacteria bacterium CG_4_10_14_0_2_um_filter_37_12 TaxID=1974637 RepID=A0A2M7V9T6_9BACT|nr:MAG: 4-hydroxybutyrate CoA-transferase [Candidatus Magasanikbacteria bacterium CG_4_10_14_0_2_um_filter_37_12]
MIMIVATGVRASEPQILMKEIKSLDKQVILLHSRTLYKNEYNPKHKIISTFLDKHVADIAEYTPIHFSRIPQYFDQLKIDVAILQVAYDKKLGYSFGTNPDYNFYFSQAKEIWVEVNKQMPWTYGPKFPAKKITKQIEVDYPLAEYINGISEDEGDIFTVIGTFLNRFISEDCTVQLGVGKLQSTLDIRSKVSIYSEMIGDWVMNLNCKKIVAGFGMGSTKFYRWLDHNSKVELRPIGDITNPLSFAKIPKLVSINSALEIDLLGQSASESLDYKQISGTGGSNDFTAGVAISKGGVSIIAMPSTTKDGSSKIVPKLQNIVTISRADVDFFVTEYGIAEMRYKTIKERQRALINIAHPKHRKWLESHCL